MAGERSTARMARAEREDLLALAESLTDEQWETPSLCEGWTVEQVVAHVVSYEELGRGELPTLMLKARGNPHTVNDQLVERALAGGRDGLLDRLRRHLDPSGLTAQYGGRIALTDGLIHRQDVRRPLGLGTDLPPDRLLSALTFAMVAPPIRGVVRTRGLRLRATDVDWSFGWGLTVSGPGEALLLAASGRPAPLDELEGAGVPLLRARLTPRAEPPTPGGRAAP